MSPDMGHVKCTERMKGKKQGQEAEMQRGHSLSCSSRGLKLVAAFCSEALLSCIHLTAAVFVRLREACSRIGEDGGISVELHMV